MKRLITAVFAISLMFGQFPEPGQGSGGGSGGGGVAVTSLGELTDCKVTRTSATVLSIAACKARIGNKIFTFASAMTATLSGTVASSTAYLYVDLTGAMVVGHNGAATITCSGCTTATGVTANPEDSIPVSTATYTSSNWDVSGITEERPILSRDILKAGALISLIPDAAGVLEISSTQTAGLKSITLFDPVTGDSGRIQFEFPAAVTITSITCSVKAATSATINLDERAQATPDTSGTAVLTSDLACDTDSATSTTFTNAGIAANVPVALTISAVSGTPDTLRVHVSYTVN